MFLLWCGESSTSFIFNCWSPKTVVCICLLNCKLGCENGFYGVVLLWSHLELGVEHKHDKYFSLWRHTLLEGHWNNMKLELFVYEIRFIHYFGEELWNVNLTFHWTITAPAWTHLEVWYSIQKTAVNFIDQILQLE